jgi:hypothetical protein
MLKILNILGQDLELSDKVAVPIQRNNMLFNSSDTLFQDVVYNFGAPLSPRNKIFIKNAHLVNADISLYQIPVQVFIDGFALFSCVMDFSIKNNQIEISLKPNFASKAKKVSESSLNQIDVNDQYSGLTELQMGGLMNDTVVNPQNFNYIFASVYNPLYYPTAPGSPASYSVINEYTGGFTSFRVSAPRIQMPKVISVLKIIGNILGFPNIKGNWQNSDQAQKTVMLNLRNLGELAGTNYYTFPIGMCLPKMSIAQFLKAIRERFKLSFDFDANTRSFYVESFESAKLNTPIDIAPYLEAVTEINAPEQKGYKISLKVDEGDSLWNSGTDDEPFYGPQLQLIIGEENDTITIPAGTLKTHLTMAATNSLPMVNDDNTDYFAANAIDLRLFKFDGAGLSSALDLTLADADFYQFLNYAKQYRVIANLPSHILTKITSTSIITFKSKHGEYVKALVEKLSADLNVTKQYTKVDILCRSLNYSVKSTPVLRDNLTVLGDGDFILLYLKSNYKDLLPEITVKKADNATIALTIAKNKLPCDKFGVGGQPQPAYPPLGVTTTFFYDLTIRITQGKPLQLRYVAERANFVLQLDGSYIATLTAPIAPTAGETVFVVY